MDSANGMPCDISERVLKTRANGDDAGATSRAGGS